MIMIVTVPQNDYEKDTEKKQSKPSSDLPGGSHENFCWKTQYLS
jgi:hypothetical protein